MYAAILALLLQLNGAMPGFTPQTYTVFMLFGDTPAAVQLRVALIAPKILAIANVSVGQDAFEECMGQTNSSLACEAARANAIIADANKRFEFAITAIFVQKVPWEVAFKQMQLILLPL